MVVAGHHLKVRVYAEAIRAYRRAVEMQPAAKIHTTLGDVYRTVHLYRFAAESYRQALRLAADEADRAAAELGLGQVEYVWRRFPSAATHFQVARDVYLKLGLRQEAEEAAAGARSPAGESAGDLRASPATGEPRRP